jgi:hypothetical protein
LDSTEITRGSYRAFISTFQGRTPSGRRPCLCRLDHKFADCPYLIISKQPIGWIADPKIKLEIQDKLGRIESLRTTVERVQREAAATTAVQNEEDSDDEPSAF